MRYLGKLLLLLMLGVGAAQSVELSDAEIKKRIIESEPAKIVKMIQKGGYVIYFRHAHTDHSQSDNKRQDLASCVNQRNLDALGKREAKVIGAAFRLLEIPVGDVRSSPWCRAKDTATLAFGRADVSYNLSFSISKSRDETEALAKALKKMLAEKPEKGTNTLLFAHTSNLKDAANVWPKPEAAMAVFKPHGKDGFEFLGMIKPTYWFAAMAEAQ